MNTLTKRTLLIAILLYGGLSLQAQTTFFTETWETGDGAWNVVNGQAWVANGWLTDSPYDQTDPLQMMYTPSLPSSGGVTNWNYAIQSTIVCPGWNQGATFKHYLRGGAYEIDYTLNDSYLNVWVSGPGYYIGSAWNIPCGTTITSSISASTLTAAVNGSVVFSASDGNGQSGGPGVGLGSLEPNGTLGLGTTLLISLAPPNPSPPTNLAGHGNAWQVNLSWTPSSGGTAPSSYNVYKQSGGGSFTNIASVAASSCSSQTCQFVDYAVAPATQYQYQVTSYAYSVESTPDGPLTITTETPQFAAPSDGGPVDYAAVWGAGPEKIALLTGTLALRLPVASLKQQSRGPGFQLQAAYNTQFWTQDSAGAHMIAIDTGYGLGWTFQVAAIYGVYSGSTLVRYEMQDSGGVIHKLYQVGSSTKFQSQDSTYMVWDYAARTLTFTSAAAWTFGCISLDPEADAGTFYPTQLEDTNGNLISISYQPASGSSQANSSSRIVSIADSQTNYTWNYTTINGQPHVSQIYHYSSPGQQFNDAQFTYSTVSGSSGLGSPFSTALNGQPLTAVLLTGISYTAAVGPFTFSYNTNSNGTTSGEINKVIFPYKGYFRYAYTTNSFSGGALLTREIATRYMSADGTSGSEQAYAFSHPSGDASLSMHTQTTLTDPVANQKQWNFIYGDSAGWDNGLNSQMLTYQGASTVLQTVNDTWTQDNTSLTTIDNPRVYAVNTILQDGQTQSRTEQDVDSNGNVLAKREYALGYGSPGALYRTTSTTYPALSVNLYGWNLPPILNQPGTVIVCPGAAGCSAPLSNTSYGYDWGTFCNIIGGNIADAPGLMQHDGNYSYWGKYDYPYCERGNPTMVTANGIVTYLGYDIGGNLLKSTDALGHVSSTSYQNTGQVSSVASGGNSTSVSYNQNLTVNQVVGTNNETQGWGYSSGTYRPMSTTNPDTSVTHYTYSDGGVGNAWTYPFVNTTTSPAGKVAQTVLDGFGRTILSSVQEVSGTSQVWISTQTQYNPCSCSASGKAVATSRPYHSDINGNAINGDTVYWTTTNSDGLGRPVSVTLPDGNQTTYAYAIENDTVNGQAWLGSQTTITDPMGKQKRYLYDGFGQLLRVDEPNSSNTLAETARYGYDAAGHMLTVGMRKADGSYMQTRTFTYSAYATSGVWGLLASATTPEKGTVTYTYYSNGMLNIKTDAKGQTLTYVYDSNNRLTAINNAQGSAVTTFGYDGDSSTYSPSNPMGHMTTAWNYSGYTWHYSYDVMGRATSQTLQTSNGNLQATYTYDSDGNLLSYTNPGAFSSTLQTGPSVSYTNDMVGRQVSMTTPNGSAGSAAYNAAGQLTGWQETYPQGSSNYTYQMARTYNAQRGWLTAATATAQWGSDPAVLNVSYGFNSDGQATSFTDTINPNQSAAYTYL